MFKTGIDFGPEAFLTQNLEEIQMALVEEPHRLAYGNDIKINSQFVFSSGGSAVDMRSK